MDNVLKLIGKGSSLENGDLESRGDANGSLGPQEVNPPVTFADLLALYPGLPVVDLVVSATSISKVIRWGSSRYIERKNWVVATILEAVDSGRYCFRHFIAGSTIEKHGFGSWRYTLLIDEKSNKYLVDAHVGKVIYKLI